MSHALANRKCSEMSTWKFGLLNLTSVWTVSLIQWDGRISHPCNLIGPLNFFQAREECDQFRTANGMNSLLRHHKGNRSNNKDACSKSNKTYRSQKTKGLYVADFATLSDETRSRSTIFPLFIWIKNLAFEKLKGSNVRNFLGFRKLI